MRVCDICLTDCLSELIRSPSTTAKKSTQNTARLCIVQHLDTVLTFPTVRHHCNFFSGALSQAHCVSTMYGCLVSG